MLHYQSETTAARRADRPGLRHARDLASSRSIISSNPPAVPLLHRSLKACPQPRARHLATCAAAPLCPITPLCANLPPPPPTHLLLAVHATPARAPRAAARRGGGRAAARCGGAVGGGLRARSQRHLPASELTPPRASCVCAG